MKKYLIGAIIGLVLGVLGNLLASYIQKDLLQDTFTPLSIILIILFMILGIAIAGRLETSPSVPGANTNHAGILYWILTAIISCTVIGFGLIVILSGQFRSRPLTIYFVVDATEKMQPIFNIVQAQLQIASSGLSGDTRIGLRVFGGNPNDLGECQENQQIVSPIPYEKGKDLLASSLSEIAPQGHSSMTGAILQTLLYDLENETRRSVRLILITSGIDRLCDPPSGDLVSDFIVDRNVELIIVSIGEQNEQNIGVFNSYAEAFQGKYLSVENASELSPIVQSISLYGYGYGNLNITPVP